MAGNVPSSGIARPALLDGSLSLRERGRVRESTAGKSFMLSATSAHIALPVSLLRYISYGAGSAQGAASRRRPLYPRAPASNIATAWCLRLIPAGFGSGRGSVRAKHGPQPASMRAAPAFRERLSDVEAATPAVSVSPGPAVIWVCRPGQAYAATRQKGEHISEQVCH